MRGISFNQQSPNSTRIFDVQGRFESRQSLRACYYNGRDVCSDSSSHGLLLGNVKVEDKTVLQATLNCCGELRKRVGPTPSQTSRNKIREMVLSSLSSVILTLLLPLAHIVSMRLLLVPKYSTPACSLGLESRAKFIENPDGTIEVPQPIASPFHCMFEIVFCECLLVR